MCAGMADLGLALLIGFVAIISTIFSPIVFIYMAKFKGKMILISALFLLIFGWTLNFTLSMLSIGINIHVARTITTIINNILVLINIEHYIIIIAMILFYIGIFFSFCFIVTLYGILGYACRKWRIKNNIPFNYVLEKDALVIMIAFLICNIMLSLNIIQGIISKFLLQ